MNFSDFGLDPRLLKGVADMGFTAPTPIQQQAIPAAIDGRDTLAAAMTGSGKTAAFLLPLLHRLLSRPRGATRVLVVTPTRELAAQIHDHFRELAKHTPLTAATVFGGVAMGPQEAAFRNGVDVLIATPGRLLDHLERPYANLDRIEALVLDEADRMLDMGFLPDVRRVLAKLPKKRQTLFFSATLPPEVQKLSKDMLVDPVALNVERKAAPATGVTQVVFPVSRDLKSALLLELLRRGALKNVIVFTRTKHRTNRLSEYLEKHGVANARMHGNRSQAQRTDALAAFKDRRIQVLVATDIVARGIDVEQLEHVVNFDVPHLPEDYIHRVGRTARADAVGEAFTFVSDDEESDLYAIEKAIGRKLPRQKLEGFDYTHRPSEQLEIPIGQRIAEIRAKKAEERRRAQEKAARRAGALGMPRPPGEASPRGGSSNRGGGAPRGGSAPSGGRGPGRAPSSDRPPERRADHGAPRTDRSGPPPRPRDPDAREVAPGIWRSGGNRGSGR